MNSVVNNPTNIEKSLKAYLVENSSVSISGDIDPEENLLDGGILDSLGIAEITEFMEKTFGIEIDEDEISANNYKSLSALTSFCRSKIAARAA